MYRNSIVCFSIVVLLLIAGCAKPSIEDVNRLNLLKASYGNKYDFKLADEFYLITRMKTHQNVNEDELITIYKQFLFTDGKKRESSFIYVNVYDDKNTFLFQIYYDPNTKSMQKGKREFY